MRVTGCRRFTIKRLWVSCWRAFLMLVAIAASSMPPGKLVARRRLPCAGTTVGCSAAGGVGTETGLRASGVAGAVGCSGASARGGESAARRFCRPVATNSSATVLVRAGDAVRLWLQNEVARIEMSGVAEQSARNGRPRAGPRLREQAA